MAQSDMVVFDSIARSNAPQNVKSIIREWGDKILDGEGSRYIASRGHNYASRFQVPPHGMVREGVESVAIGGLLGAISAARADGMTIKTPVANIPADGLFGVVAAVASALLSKSSPHLAQDARTASNVGLGIFGYRSAASLTSKLGFAATPSTKVAGDFGEDPIIAKARNL
jgi:hypothetical protein